MIFNPADIASPHSLEQLLHRGDIWRGRDQYCPPQTVLDTGYSPLNAALLNRGWPLGNLVEVCQQNLSHSEWLLFTPALRAALDGYLVLLNPPAIPFAQGLIQSGLDLEHILVVQAGNKADFLASFSELARTASCAVLLAWQPQQALSYTEMRKCLLATADGQGLYVLFRPASARQQSSPAALRLHTEIRAQTLDIHIFKQKGALQMAQLPSIKLPLPKDWLALPPHKVLGQTPAQERTTQVRLASAGVVQQLRPGDAAINHPGTNPITPLHGRKP